MATSCGHDNDPSGFLKTRRVSRLPEELLASYKGPCSVELVDKSLKLGHIVLCVKIYKCSDVGAEVRRCFGQYQRTEIVGGFT